jgi:hypothetical protein
MASPFTGFRDHTLRRATVGGLLWTSDQLVAETLPDNTQHKQQTNIHTLCGIRTHDRSRRVAEDLRLRSRGHWVRHNFVNTSEYFLMFRGKDLLKIS